ncbi:Phenylpyruvate tautomerase PptA, 4-oxalocrotonate tautomerase family [Micromonospora mirobrigensis]|uniref:Phenylpyruvate tautomerase PptA, 4-oxalocrotonate tautomerase family n=2 Tax=Micromonospora mirobrigensis TaxID=262898 RepID=A0A1C5AKM5_9ACTN|nr:Phenylpyruvate tautomerase PptA, 4-oxalocrotonate tautomerase family [Micromonospora mirobrigensis]
MPMVGIYIPDGLLARDGSAALAQDVALAVLRHEGSPLRSPYLENAAVYVHETPVGAVATAAGPAPGVVRVQVMTPPGALSRESQRNLVAEVTRMIAEAVGDPAVVGRTWVTLTEAAEGGWGVAGVALGRAEFAAARAATEGGAPA